MNREQTIREWQEHIEVMVNALLDFRQAIGTVQNDFQFRQAYRELVTVAGDVLDGVKLRSGGIDDLRETLTGEV